MKRFIKRLIEKHFYNEIQPMMTEKQVLELSKADRKMLLRELQCKEKIEGGEWGTDILKNNCYVNADGNIYIGFHNAFDRGENCIQYSLTPTEFKVKNVSRGQIMKMNFLKWLGVDVFSLAKTYEEYKALRFEIMSKKYTKI